MVYAIQFLALEKPCLLLYREGEKQDDGEGEQYDFSRTFHRGSNLQK
jgi:hypothetical protein